MEFLTNYMAVHVNWDVLCVRPADYCSAAHMHAEVPWCKVACLAAQYLPPEGHVKPGPLGKSYGELLLKADWDKLEQAGSGASLTRLKEADSFLVYFWNAYRKCEGICPKKLALELPAAFVRVLGHTVRLREPAPLPWIITRSAWATFG